ncbi:MAG: helix-turn-helix domain-containing protein [Myxococcales bacterium]|nr:helix-turn-helix domain-containing protein [Myxococcales bacterium]
MSRAALASALRALAPAVAAVLDAAAAALEATPPEWLPVRELELPRRTVRAAIRSGELAVRLVGREHYVRRDVLDAWVEGQMQRTPTPAEPSARASAARAIAAAAPRLRAMPGGGR